MKQNESSGAFCKLPQIM